MSRNEYLVMVSIPQIYGLGIGLVLVVFVLFSWTKLLPKTKYWHWLVKSLGKEVFYEF